MTRQSVCGSTARVLLVLFAALLLAVPVVLAAEDDVPVMVRQEIEFLLKKKASDLVADKDANGVRLKRGAWSNAFRKVDNTTYEITFHRDTIETGVRENDQIKTERLLLTAKKGSDGKWTLAKEEVKDTQVKLFRTLPDTRTVYGFDSFSFDREGLKATANGGQFFQLIERGQPAGMVLVAPDLKYNYAVPSDVPFPWYAVTLKRLLREHPDDVVFTPEWLYVNCDASTCAQILEKQFKGVKKIDGEPLPKLQGLIRSAERKYQDEFKKDPFGSGNPFPRTWTSTQPFFSYVDPDQRYWSLAFLSEPNIPEVQSLIMAAFLGAPPSVRVFALGYDNFEPWEISVATSRQGPLFGYNAEDVRKSGIPPYELERRDDSATRLFDLRGLSGTVDVALQDPETIVADVKFVMRTKVALQTLPFGISRIRFPGESDKEARNPKLFINSIRDSDGNDLTFVKVGGYGGLVLFPKVVPAGTELTLQMQFENQQAIYSLNPTYSAMDRGGWLPFVNYTDPIEQFDLTTRSPARFQILGPGRKASESRQGDVVTTRWTSSNPVSFPTIIFGDYVEDGPSVPKPATKMDGTAIPVRVYVDKTSMNAVNVESLRSNEDVNDAYRQVSGGARDIRARNLRAVADQAVNALNVYREIYGINYPFDKLDLVCDPLGAFYGQAPASIIYLGYGVFKSEGALAGGGTQLTKFNKDVVAHETGHQWWGSAVNNANFRNYWFVESLAELSSALYVEAYYGREKYLEKIAQWRKTILDNDIMSSVQDGYTLWAGDTGGSPIANIYNKGPFAFHVLRETYGDEKFFAFLKSLAQTLSGKSIITSDIERVAQQTYGFPMGWFFDQWIRGVGIPQYALNYTVRQTEDGKWLVDGTVKQRVVAGKYNDVMPNTYFTARGYLTLIFANGKEMKWPPKPKPGEQERPFVVKGAETPFRFKLPEEPAAVEFNKDNEILAQDVLVNKSGW